MGSRRVEKALDPNLFVRKAQPVQPQEAYIAPFTFNELPIHETLKQNIATRGYTMPTEIQAKTIPHIMEGKDVIGIANTGTGKTAAFLVPFIDKLVKTHGRGILIVVPTRELATQIEDEFVSLAQNLRMHAVSLVGGLNIKRQMYALQRRPQVVIATPGRLKDLIERQAIDIRSFHSIVLDEADRMVDMGFIQDITFIISLLPKNRQSLFFSATVDGKTKQILTSFVSNPVTVSVKQQETSENIEQNIVRITREKPKLDVLIELLQRPDFTKVLVFGRTKWGMERLSRELVQRGFRAAAIHGNKTQNQRQRAVDQFKTEQLQVLIATDVASRGLDINDITHVINYDAPTSYEDYVHRIGRTGRAGKRGYALTFVE